MMSMIEVKDGCIGDQTRIPASACIAAPVFGSTGGPFLPLSLTPVSPAVAHKAIVVHLPFVNQSPHQAVRKEGESKRQERKEHRNDSNMTDREKDSMKRRKKESAGILPVDAPTTS